MENPTPKTIERFLFEHASFKTGDVLQRIYFKARAISQRHFEKVMNSEINPEILEIFEGIINDEESEYFEKTWLEYAENELSTDKIATLLMAAADIDPDTTRTMAQNARKNHCRRKFLTAEHLMVLVNFEKLSEITEANLRDLIHFAATGKMNSAELELHLEVNFKYLSNDNSKIYQTVKQQNLMLDETTIDFFAHKVPFTYLERVKNLYPEWRDEFWRWVFLKYSTDISKPERIFFENFENREVLDLNLTNFEKMRDWLSELGQNGLSGLELSKNLVDFDYDYSKEVLELETKLEEYRKYSFSSKEKTNIHHIFFPESAYKNSPALAKFRNREENKVRILVHAHNSMNEKFAQLRKSHGYEIPTLSEATMQILQANRKNYATGYENYLEIRRVLAETCRDYVENYSRQELENHEDFQNAAKVYQFLKICSKFITPRTTRMYLKIKV